FSPDDFVLLWLGIFMPHRRLQDAIQAIHLLKSRGVKARLLLAGSDRSYPEYLTSLRTLARKLEVEDRVTFAGKVADEEITDFYCASDTFLFPNENQTWGLAVFEAMACGRPVLVSTGAAVHEVLTDMKDALLFPARNPETLSKKIELLMSNVQLRQSIAREGRALALTYTWNRFAEQNLEVFHDILQNEKPDYEPATVR
ncbi:MAG TPA: glycosyltransferase family 4 protein, partial [Alphaproteobacteria bacterium]|nr:glycosyltransferase family 4 protein [Alphaproteobacteria bacterium]